jgi:hypothetical protein
MFGIGVEPALVFRYLEDEVRIGRQRWNCGDNICHAQIGAE